MLNFPALLTEHCTRSKSARPGDQELFFSRPKLTVSRLRRPGTVRAQPCNWQNSQLYAGPITHSRKRSCVICQSSKSIRRLMQSAFSFSVRGIHCTSKRIASLCKSNFMLPTSIILAAVCLSVNHLTSEPFKIGAKDSRERL